MHCGTNAVKFSWSSLCHTYFLIHASFSFFINSPEIVGKKIENIWYFARWKTETRFFQLYKTSKTHSRNKPKVLEKHVIVLSFYCTNCGWLAGIVPLYWFLFMQPERSVPSLTQQQFEAVTRLKGQNKGVSRVNIECCCILYVWHLLVNGLFLY